MRYYTTVYFYHSPEWVRYEHRYTPSKVRGLVFMDDQFAVRLEDAVHAARAFWPQQEGGPKTFLARPVRVSVQANKHTEGWAFTPDLAPPSVEQAESAKDIVIFDDLYEDAPPRPLDLREIFDGCTSLFRLSGGCPCPSGRSRATFPEEGLYASRYDMTRCGLDLVWPHVKPTVPPTYAAVVDVSCDDLPTRYPKKILEFERLTAGDIMNKMIPKRLPTVDEIEIDRGVLEHFAEIRSKAAKDAAYTRNFKKNECSRCVFKAKCNSYGIHRCDGAASLDEVRTANDRRGAVWKEPEGFTPQQVAWLMTYPSLRDSYTAVKGTFCRNVRERQVRLCYFDDYGRFVVAAANSRSDDSDTYSTWGALVHALPELATWEEKFSELPLISDDVKRVYALIRLKRCVSRRGMCGYHDYALECLETDSRGVSCYYGRNNRVCRYIRADGSDEVALYNLLCDLDSYGYQMYRENG